MKLHQTSIGKNDEWLTPIEIIQPLGKFDLDPATCKKAWRSNYYQGLITEGWSSNGLDKDWFGRIWLNPPFNRYERPKWMDRMSYHNNGTMLIPAACETKAFKEYVWKKAAGVLFLDERPHFHYADGTRAAANSGCTICLVAYGENNLTALLKSGLGTTVKPIIL